MEATDARAAKARTVRPELDVMQHPRVLGDGEMQRLVGLRQALVRRLRATERRLLAAVKGAADYDVVAGEALASLQDERLLLRVALHQLDLRRQRRARAIVDGVAAAAPKPPAADGDPLAPLLQQAQAALDHNRQDDESRGAFSLGMSDPVTVMSRADERTKATPAPRRRGSSVLPEDTELAAEMRPDEPAPPPAGASPAQRPRRVEAAVVQVPVSDATALASALRRQLPRMRACLSGDQLQAGLAFTVRARLSPDGRVRGVRLLGPRLSPAATACVVAVLTRVRLPRGGVGRVVSVPLRVSAS